LDNHVRDHGSGRTEHGVGDDIQFDSLRCGTPVKLASMVDEHTRESLLDITDTSITSERVIQAMQKIIDDRGAPLVIRC